MKHRKRTPQEKEQWMALMQNVEQLMCANCGALPCMCPSKRLNYAFILYQAAKRSGLVRREQ